MRLLTQTALSTLLLLGIGSGGFAQAQRPGAVTPESPLSENVLKQIQILNDAKENRTPAQRKIDNNLLLALRRQEGKLPAELNSLRTNVKTDMVGRVMVEIKGKLSKELLLAITRSGAEVVSIGKKQGRIIARVGLGWLESFANRSDVQQIRRYVPPTTSGGDFISEGAGKHGSLYAQTRYGATGAGVAIGVISDSASEESIVAAQANDELPPDSTSIVIVPDPDLPPTPPSTPFGSVSVLPGQGGTGTDEGTAMMEVIYDLAPNAPMTFATGGPDEETMFQNVLDLANPLVTNSRILIDDITFDTESPFQESLVGSAIRLASENFGTLIFTAAGNSGNKVAGTSSVWQGDFSNSGVALRVLAGRGRLHRFGPGNAGVFNTVQRTGLVKLWWADPVGNASNDYDLYVLNAAGTAIVAAGNLTQLPDLGTDPFESVDANTNERIVIVAFDNSPTVTTESRALSLQISGTSTTAGLSINTSGSTLGHSASDGAFTVGATNVATSDYSLFSSAALAVAPYSAQGDRRIFFEANGAATTPDNFLFSTGGRVIGNKPDFLAASNVQTGQEAFRPFSGTSAAVPHAAAIAAQLLSVSPSLSNADVIDILRNTAIPPTAGLSAASGSGVLMADRAVRSVVEFVDPASIKVTPTQTSVTVTWTTSLPANSSLEVFRQPDTFLETSDGSFTTSHSLTITGLTPNTIYQYLVSSSNSSGSLFGSKDGEFKTLPVVATTSALIQATDAFGLISGSKLSRRTRFVVTLTNTGETAATDIVLGAAALGASAQRTPTLPMTLLDSTGKPIVLGAGESTTVTLDFPLQASRQSAKLRLTGTYRLTTATTTAKFSTVRDVITP
jgi:hypothetical protein